MAYMSTLMVMRVLGSMPPPWQVLRLSPYAYDIACDSYRTLGLMTPLCLPFVRSFLMAVTFYVQILTQL